MEIALKVLLIIASIGLICAVLLQKGKSAGLSGAISGGAEHLFGKQKARGLELFLSRLTMGLATAFFILAIVVAYFVKSSTAPSLDLTTPPATSAPATGATTTPPATGTAPATGTTPAPATGTTPAPATGATPAPAAGTTTPPAATPAPAAK